jgi:hypothetical protein
MHDLHEWSFPVFLQHGNQPEEFRRFSDTRDAAHFMTCEWNWRRTESYEKTLRICGLVVRGFVDPEYARSAFLSATEEAGIWRF